MANEILTATDASEFATTMLGRPRNEATGANQLKEQSGIAIGEGYVLTDSRFLTPTNGGPADPADLSVQRGAAIGGAEGPLVTATTIIELASDDATEIALVETSDDAGPAIGLVVYADPNEAAGMFTATGYSRSDDGAAARAYDFTLGAGAYETQTLKNRTATDDVWMFGFDPADQILLTGGAGFYQSLDIDGDGAATDYAAGLLVGPYVRQSADDFRFAVDPIGDVYAAIAAELERAGVNEDALARMALIASSAGGEVNGTFLNEDISGGAAADTLNGLDGDDLLVGGLGDDSLDGGRNLDTLLGGEGEDRLRGRSGADELDGGEGRDRMFGGGGGDELRGGDGVDRLDGGGGADVVIGGAGNDIFVFSNNGDDTITDFTLGEDRLHVRRIDAANLSDLTLTDLAPGQVEVSKDGLSVVLYDGDGVADFTSADFNASDFIFA
ncbi:MAG: hypothetical protein AAF360_04235 [Pseudomonadota bacterium]